MPSSPQLFSFVLSGEPSCLLWMEGEDCKVSLNPNLFELGKLRLMLNSSPAEAARSPPRLSLLACPAVSKPQGSPGFIQLRGCPHVSGLPAKFQQKDDYARFKPNGCHCGTHGPGGSRSGERKVHLWERHHLPCSLQSSSWLLPTALS